LDFAHHDVSRDREHVDVRAHDARPARDVERSGALARDVEPDRRRRVPEGRLVVADSIQASFGAGIEREFAIGGLELPIRHFHDAIENAIDRT